MTEPCLRRRGGQKESENTIKGEGGREGGREGNKGGGATYIDQAATCPQTPLEEPKEGEGPKEVIQDVAHGGEALQKRRDGGTEGYDG